jgi:nitrate reductase gamma subunit
MIYFIHASYAAFLFCVTMLLIHFFKLIKRGAPKDLSEKSGSVAAGVFYANTGAMSPVQKESAYKHLPTYTAGILFHIGSFLAFSCFIFLFFDEIITYFASNFFFQHTFISLFIALSLWASSFFGIGLIIKRIVSKKLRPISNIDDYFSTIIVTMFQIHSALLFTLYAYDDWFHKYFSHDAHNAVIATYFLVATWLFLYLPFGKLKHIVYYFAARYHLGFFYGRRGTWPPPKKNEQ